MASTLWKRQGGPIGDNNNQGYGGYNGYDSYDDGDVDWWWTSHPQTGMAVRYAIVAILFAALLLFFVGGYYHAQRRVRRGLPPLTYHRWMVRRSYYYPPQQQPQYPYPARNSYGMEGYPPPPPAYNNYEAPPPVYQPPQGASKAMADQNWRETGRPGEGSGSAGVAAPGPAAQ
ncbi:uncharacterized protein LTR77_003942 [Saxophila tyrrhenica]|uniref:Uncharacterized protein n=1 Tax=Saxophila tyrrhenica TaxID=1690608 RepID=A0AAV9PIK4_9PEZI|nr:hypothetical protein LTR77_003942 [Saxophila tyrrhenica]